jgi:glutamate-1-semialdehyde 2,1-aminomutase
VREAATHAEIPVQVGTAGSMWGFFLADQPVTDYAGAKRADTARYARLFHALLDAGVYLAPSQFEVAFVATAHNAETLAASRAALTAAFAAAADE